jgi:hypothetical protein
VYRTWSDRLDKVLMQQSWLQSSLPVESVLQADGQTTSAKYSAWIQQWSEAERAAVQQLMLQIQSDFEDVKRGNFSSINLSLMYYKWLDLYHMRIAPHCRKMMDAGTDFVEDWVLKNDAQHLLLAVQNLRLEALHNDRLNTMREAVEAALIETEEILAERGEDVMKNWEILTATSKSFQTVDDRIQLLTLLGSKQQFNTVRISYIKSNLADAMARLALRKAQKSGIPSNSTERMELACSLRRHLPDLLKENSDEQNEGQQLLLRLESVTTEWQRNASALAEEVESQYKIFFDDKKIVDSTMVQCLIDAGQVLRRSYTDDPRVESTLQKVATLQAASTEMTQNIRAQQQSFANLSEFLYNPDKLAMIKEYAKLEELTVEAALQSLKDEVDDVMITRTPPDHAPYLTPFADSVKDQITSLREQIREELHPPGITGMASTLAKGLGFTRTATIATLPTLNDLLLRISHFRHELNLIYLTLSVSETFEIDTLLRKELLTQQDNLKEAMATLVQHYSSNKKAELAALVLMDDVLSCHHAGVPYLPKSLTDIPKCLQKTTESWKPVLLQKFEAFMASQTKMSCALPYFDDAAVISDLRKDNVLIDLVVGAQPVAQSVCAYWKCNLMHSVLRGSRIAVRIEDNTCT